MGPTRFDQLDSLFVGYRLPLRDRLAEALITSSVDVQASIEEGWMMDYTYPSLSLSSHQSCLRWMANLSLYRSSRCHDFLLAQRRMMRKPRLGLKNSSLTLHGEFCGLIGSHYVLLSRKKRRSRLFNFCFSATSDGRSATETCLKKCAFEHGPSIA